MAHPVRAVVISGCGVVSPFGVGVPAFWEGLTRGECALAPVRGFPAGDLEPRVAGEARALAWSDLDRAGALALWAADEALARAGLSLDRYAPSRRGVALGTTLGGMALFERWMGGQSEPAELHRIPYFAPAARLAEARGCAGPVVTPQLACASGTHAVAVASEWVRRGRVDVALAGGTDFLCRFVLAGFNALKATADTVRPFDRARHGLALGEGSAVVVLEAEESVRARGGPVCARILGAGAAGDAVHLTAPDREGAGAARAMLAALRAAELDASAVGFVSAHGTGTVYNDAMEAAALARVFAARRVPVNSIKGAIGHTLGAAGALEVVACVQTLNTGVVPPTVGLEEPDAVCRALDLVMGTARETTVRVALSTSSGFAGANAALVLGQP